MASKTKTMNSKRRLAVRREPAKARDFNALALIVSRKGGHHGDARKEQSRKACRGRVDY